MNTDTIIGFDSNASELKGFNLNTEKPKDL